MMPSLRLRLWASLVVVLGGAAAPAPAVEAGKLLPADADTVWTVNVRQLLNSHKNTDIVQPFLLLYKLALQGDEKQLKQYYENRSWLKNQGITESDLLSGARLFKTASDALGLDVVQDVERVSLGFRRSDTSSWAAIVEGRFQEDKWNTGLTLLSKITFGAIKSTRVGGRDFWQLTRDDKGVHLAVLNSKTLALASSKQGLDELLKQKAGLAPGMRLLLEEAGAEHFALIANQAPILLKSAAQLLEDAGADDALGKLIVSQVAAWIRANADDIGVGSVGLSLEAEEVRLHLGARTTKPEVNKQLAAAFNNTVLFGSLGLLAVDDEVARQFSGVMRRARMSAKDTTLVISAPVSYAFLGKVVEARSGPGYATREALSRVLYGLPFWGPPKAQPGAFSVEEVRNIAYRDGADADSYRHRLDVYRPKGKKDCPVVVLVHGGSWFLGDNRFWGLYTAVGHFLAGQGIVAILPNYRLAPSAKHPDQVKDVAAAVRWARDNCGRHGGNPEQLFLLGHSAGGHLVSLLTTDESRLKAVDLRTADIRGVIAVSGVYRIPAETPEFTVGGSGPVAGRLDQLFPARGATMPLLNGPIGVPLLFDVYDPAFGSKAKDRADASPLTFVRRGLPPFLILTAEHDLPTLPEMADEFHRALVREGCNSRLVKVGRRNHAAILFTAITTDDPAARAILDFVRGQAGKK